MLTGNETPPIIVYECSYDPISQKSGNEGFSSKTLIDSFVRSQISRANETKNDCVDLRNNFEKMAANWRQATSNFSLNMRRFTHPTYQVMMHALRKADSRAVISLILNELRNRPDMWFEALKEFSGFDAASGATTFDDAIAAWVAWGKKEKYIF